MCEAPSWSSGVQIRACELLHQMIGEEITSLDFKLALREQVGPLINIVQEDCSRFLRRWFEQEGRLIYDSQTEGPDGQTHICYRPKVQKRAESPQFVMVSVDAIDRHLNPMELANRAVHAAMAAIDSVHSETPSTDWMGPALPEPKSTPTLVWAGKFGYLSVE